MNEDETVSAINLTNKVILDESRYFPSLAIYFSAKSGPLKIVFKGRVIVLDIRFKSSNLLPEEQTKRKEV